ncbi:FAD-dependent oxidoreductase [Gordonia sp. CPCC 206044]|uniref:NAD(P)/FAD-dependent oxidoreductase n=1 Tax=Gordonia sp. CPCC 206044 TaxID=3140793 RepID=UPI003AF3BE72
MSITSVAVVGTGHAATVTARTLRRRGFDGSITLFGDETHAPYQRPPLSKEFLAGTADDTSLALLTPKVIADNDITIRTGAHVQSLDPIARSLSLSGGESVTADAVVLATGGRPRELPGFPMGSPRVHYLRTLDDATRLRDRLQAGARLAIVGGGFIGLEIAATARGFGLDVTVIEVGAQILEPRLGTQIAGLCADLHRGNGVDLRCGVGVASVDTGAAGVRLTLTDESVLDVDDVVVGVGIDPNTELAVGAGLDVANGVVVDAVGRTSVPGIYAVGDVAARYSQAAGRHVRVEHVDNANRQGAVVARAILGEDKPDDSAHWFWSDQYEYNIQFTGNHQGADDLVVRGIVADNEFSAFYLRGGQLTAAFAIDRGEDIMAAREMLGRTFDRTMLADEDVDLWELGEEVVH